MAGSFVLIVLWIYYSSMIFFRAGFTAIYLQILSEPLKPKPGAVLVQNGRETDRQRGW